MNFQKDPYQKLWHPLAETFQQRPQLSAIMTWYAKLDQKVAFRFWAISKKIFKNRQILQKYIDNMCRMGRWSYWCWFAVNRSTFHEDMLKTDTLIHSDHDLQITLSLTSASTLSMYKYKVSMVFQFGRNERYVRYVTNKQISQKWGIFAGEISYIGKGSFWFWFDV